MISVGDYISFTRIIQPAERLTSKSATGQRFDIITQPEIVILQSGSGIVNKINTTKKRIGGTNYGTARVDTGPVLGVVSVVLDDAVIIGVQQELFTNLVNNSGSVNMYDQSGDHA